MRLIEVSFGRRRDNNTVYAWSQIRENGAIHEFVIIRSEVPKPSNLAYSRRRVNQDQR
jgi:hypothetical protein